jgi:hypothetical protein
VADSRAGPAERRRPGGVHRGLLRPARAHRQAPPPLPGRGLQHPAGAVSPWDRRPAAPLCPRSPPRACRRQLMPTAPQSWAIGLTGARFSHRRGAGRPSGLDGAYASSRGRSRRGAIGGPPGAGRGGIVNSSAGWSPWGARQTTHRAGSSSPPGNVTSPTLGGSVRPSELRPSPGYRLVGAENPVASCDLMIRSLWVPTTMPRSLISAFAADRPEHRGPRPAQHDRPPWPSDSSTCCSFAC